MSFWQKKKQSNQEDHLTSETKRINTSIEDNIKYLNKILKNDIDFSIRKFLIGKVRPAAVVYIDSLADKEIINRDIIRPLQEHDELEAIEQQEKSQSLSQWFFDEVLYHCGGSIADDWKSVQDGLLHGATVVLIDGEKNVLLLDSYKPEKRGIQQPETERVIRGPRDGFIEQLTTNVSLLRYRLPILNFVWNQWKWGRGRRRESHYAISITLSVRSFWRK